MATTPTIFNSKEFDSRRCQDIIYNLVNNETGDPIKSSGIRDRSVQVVGSFGGNACRIEGSNDGTIFFTLSNSAGNDLEFVSNGLELILEPTKYIRARVIGTGNSSIQVYLFLGA